MRLTEEDLPIRNYDRQSANAIAAKLRAYTQRELHLIAAYEDDNAARTAVLDRIAELTEEEPWAGYDDQDADEIAARLDAATARRVLAYEREHQSRATVTRAAQRLAPGA